MSSPAQKFEALEKRVEELNVATAELLGAGHRLYRSLTLPPPRFDSASLGFYLCVDWLYELYSEAGRVGVDFLRELGQRLGLEVAAVNQHFQLLFAMQECQRTKEPAPASFELVGRWFSESCATKNPAQEEDWDKCLRALLEEALAFQEILQQMVTVIAEDESRPEICQEWRTQLERTPSPQDFDALITEVANDFGMVSLDVPSFRQLHYRVWRHRLRRLRSDHDFSTAARQLVEQSLLEDSQQNMPISAQDLLTTFELPPGPAIADLLKRARRYYDADPCDAQTLLEMLKPWAKKWETSVAETAPLTLRDQAIRYANAAVVLKDGRKDSVAEAVLQRLLKEQAFRIVVEALRENRKERGGMVLLLYVVACFVKNPARAVQFQGFLGEEHPRWSSSKDFRKVLVHLEKSLARGFGLTLREPFSRQHLDGEVSKEPGASVRVILSAELRGLLNRSLREECFTGGTEVLVVSTRQGEKVGLVDLSSVAGEWAVVGRWDPDGESQPDLPIRNATEELPVHLFRICFGDERYRVESVSGFGLYDGLSAQVSAVELVVGDRFLTAEHWFELARVFV